MDFKNLSELKERSAAAADIVRVKTMYGQTQISTLYRLLYTNAEFRLDLLAAKVHKLYPRIPEERVKTDMTIWEMAEILHNEPAGCAHDDNQSEVRLEGIPHPECNLYLAIIFELIFLPFYIVKDN